MTDLPDNNPKTKYAIAKPALGLIPLRALQAAAGAHALGAAKYGPWNWREHSVAASVYVNAILRHLKAWQEEEDDDPESGVSHLGHVMACCGILLDAQAQGKLVDDRPRKGTHNADHK